MITKKEYKCNECDVVSTIETNHHMHFRGCKKCRSKTAYLIPQTEEGLSHFAKYVEDLRKWREQLPKSTLTKHQILEFKKDIDDDYLSVTIRYDDSCNNGHNSFSITGRTSQCSGCIHEEIAKYYPEYVHLIKWHLWSSDGWFHVENIPYLLKTKGLEAAREYASLPDATVEQLADVQWLHQQLPELLSMMKTDIEALGFVY